MNRGFLTIIVLLAISGLAWLALDRFGAAPPAVAASADKLPVVLPGGSPDRAYLTDSESRKASETGLVPAGTLSVIRTAGPLRFGEWFWDDKGVPKGPLDVRVDLDRQLISVFRGPHEIGTAVIVYGIDGKETPRGRLPILGKSEEYRSYTYDAPMPYSLWLRDDGVAIHGSEVSASHATNGCIGVPLEFAAHLFEVAQKGDIVNVRGGSPSA